MPDPLSSILHPRSWFFSKPRRLFFISTTEEINCSNVINAFKQQRSWTDPFRESSWYGIFILWTWSAAKRVRDSQVQSYPYKHICDNMRNIRLEVEVPSTSTRTLNHRRVPSNCGNILRIVAPEYIPKMLYAAINYWMRLCRIWRILQIEEGVFRAEVDNTLRDLQNSSYPTKAEFNNCFIIHSKQFASVKTS